MMLYVNFEQFVLAMKRAPTWRLRRRARADP